MVIFAAGSHVDRPKDSAALAEESGEFTVNVVSYELAAAMNTTSGTFGAAVDEFDIAGLTPAAGISVKAPLVAESPANLECKVTNSMSLGLEGGTRLIAGEVLAIHIEESALDGDRVDPSVLDVVGRLSGNSYATTRDRFDLTRPS
jgi:flavin reductase (DIM6/NTAB) family NADH-FMN oxidoreductase RutF